MAFLVFALGLFYVAAAFLALRRIRFEWLLERALETLTRHRDPERNRLYFMTVTAALYGAAGIALLLRSSLALWLLGTGLLLQASYYGVLWLMIGVTDSTDTDRWRKAWSAAIVSTAAFAFAAYAARAGILM
jgi:hypothetical protein